MKKIPLYSCLILFVLSLSVTNAFAIFSPVKDLESGQINRIAVSKFNPSVIYVASRNSLYKSQDYGKTFKKTSVFKDEEIRHIFFDPYLADTLYIATSRHLYEVKDYLKQLYSIFQKTVRMEIE